MQALRRCTGSRGTLSPGFPSSCTSKNGVPHSCTHQRVPDPSQCHSQPPGSWPSGPNSLITLGITRTMVSCSNWIRISFGVSIPGDRPWHPSQPPSQAGVCTRSPVGREVSCVNRTLQAGRLAALLQITGWDSGGTELLGVGKQSGKPCRWRGILLALI